jgi:hypothetical protein
LRARAGLALAAALAFAVASRAGEGKREGDPVHVYFDGADCGTAEIEVEAFDRERGGWRPHPVHPRVPVKSCQTEEAGRLWNELRWRCAPWSGDANAGWRPLQVFDADVMARCELDRPRERRTAITVSSPTEGAVVRPSEPFVELRGTVDVDGRAGSNYDVVLLLDAGAPDEAVAAQIEAARAFVNGLVPRLGAVRVAVLSYPSARANVQREVVFGADLGEIDAALRHIAARPATSPTAISDALGAALGVLEHGRSSARGVIVMGVDGARLDQRKEILPGDLIAASRVGERGAALHWVVLGGTAPERPALVKRALESAHGTFRRVPPQSYSTRFFDSIELPVAESVWIEARTAPAPGVLAALDAQGGFSARVPIASGPNALVIHARTSDGALHERRFELVFDDARAQRKQVEIRAEPEKRP